MFTSILARVAAVVGGASLATAAVIGSAGTANAAPAGQPCPVAGPCGSLTYSQSNATASAVIRDGNDPRDFYQVRWSMNRGGVIQDYPQYRVYRSGPGYGSATLGPIATADRGNTIQFSVQGCNSGLLGTSCTGWDSSSIVVPAGNSLSGDSKSEVISVDPRGTLNAFPNIDALNFSYGPSSVVGVGWTDPTRLKFADLNGDGKTDVISVDANGTLRAFPNIDAMNFHYGPARTIGVGWTPARTFFADLNGDGKDEVINDDAGGTLHAYPNIDGINGVWGPSRVVGVGWTDPTRLKFADLNGDGKDDVISVDANGTLRAFPNIDALNFTYGPARTIGLGWTPARTFFADLDGDGKAEVINARSNGQLVAFPNIDALNFTYGPSSVVGFGWSDPARLMFA